MREPAISLLLVLAALITTPAAATEVTEGTAVAKPAGTSQEGVTQPGQTLQASGTLLYQVVPKALGYIAVGATLCMIPSPSAQEVGADLTQLGAEALALAAAVDYNAPIRYYLAYEFNTTYGKLSSFTYWTGVCLDAAVTVGMNFALQSMLQPVAANLNVPPDALKNYMTQACKLIAKLRSEPVDADDVVPLIDSFIQIVGYGAQIPRDEKLEVASAVATFLNGIRTNPVVLMLSDVCNSISRYLGISPSSGIKRWVEALLTPMVPDVFGILSDVREIVNKINDAMLGLKAVMNPTKFVQETVEAIVDSTINALRPIAEKATDLGLSKESVERALKDLKSEIISTINGIVARYEPVVRVMGAMMTVISMMDTVNSFNRLIQRLSKLALMARSLGVSVPSPVQPQEELRRALNVLQQGRVGPPPLPF
ncbi:hypothetical protein [Methanopyrus sp.]